MADLLDSIAGDAAAGSGISGKSIDVGLCIALHRSIVYQQRKPRSVKSRTKA
jgi:hypothetical protein